MQQYLSILRNIITNGVQQPNRTGVDTLMVPGAMMQFDLVDGMPMVTTRAVPFKPIIGELIGFCRGVTNAADFRTLGAKIWDKNANEDGVSMAGDVVPNVWLKNPNRKGQDDLGRIYGAQWRDWHGQLVEQHCSGVEQPLHFEQYAGGEMLAHQDYDSAIRYKAVDQLEDAISTIEKNPTSRRIIVNAWRPDEFDQMALPPCHVMHQYLVDTVNKKLHMTMYQRSCDQPLGVPFNITSYSLLLWIIARMTGYTPGTFTHFLADAHIYMNQIDGVLDQIERTPRQLPRLVYSGPDLRELRADHGSKVFDHIRPEDFSLDGYDPYPAISYPFNV